MGRTHFHKLVAAALAALLVTACDRADPMLENERAFERMRVVSTATLVTPGLRLYAADIVRRADGTLYLAHLDKLLEVAPTGRIRELQGAYRVRYLAK
jgi:hypothetical protein